MTTRRLSPGHGCGLCGVRDWGYDEFLGRWVCLNCAAKGVPTPKAPDFAETFDFDTWYHAVQKNFDAVSNHLATLEREPEPESEAERLIHRASLKRVHREYDEAWELSGVAMYLKHIREMAIAKGGDFYIHLPALSVQIRFNSKADI